jgi:hypothetical protein
VDVRVPVAVFDAVGVAVGVRVPVAVLVREGIGVAVGVALGVRVAVTVYAYGPLPDWSKLGNTPNQAITYLRCGCS